MIVGYPRFLQRHHRNRRVPHRRDTRLQPKPVVVVDLEPGERRDCARRHRIAWWVAEGDESEYRVHHRGENRGEAVAALEMLEQPSPSRGKRACAKWFPRTTLVPFRETIENEKDVAPADELLASPECRRPCGWIGVEL